MPRIGLGITLDRFYRNPIPDVSIDTSHAIGGNCTWCIAPAKSRRELVGNAAITLMNGATIDSVDGLVTTSTVDQGVYAPITTQTSAIADEITVAMMVYVDNFSDRARLLCNNIGNLCWGDGNTSNLPVLDINANYTWPEGTPYVAADVEWFIHELDKWALWAFTYDRIAQQAIFSVDGVKRGDTRTFSPTFNWSTNEIFIFNEKKEFHNRGILGKCRLAAIFDRVLTLTELASLAGDPYLFLNH